jgi:D-alanyl-D-alanine carboxypeptidase/D-alanyl-D-alanine-endopeptidase (penicillin-binding protein 4)
MVNDNLLDIAVTPGAAAGDATTIDLRPVTSYFEVVNQVTTSAADVPTDLGATVDGSRVVVAGTVPAGAVVQNTGVFAPDPAAYARALFIEALGRAGVSVTAPVAAAAPLPAEGSYAADAKVASLTSPPASVLAKLVLKTSHNRGAESLMCLLAVKAGSTTCDDGLTTMLTTVGTAGIDQSSVFLYDGEGTDPASATPSALIGWLSWAAKQSWGEGYRLSMPDVVNDGTILVKSGTSAAPQNPPMSSMFMVQGEAGYMTTASGRQLIVAVYAKNGTYPTVAQGLAESGPAVTAWLAAVQAAN